MQTSFALERFLKAQDTVYATVLKELRSGRKVSHWMWFIFPQIQGLGSSPMARHYAISSLAEARAYLEHPVLSKRLRECCRIVNSLRHRTALEIFGYPDDLKFRSCLTLFVQAAEATDKGVFIEALDKYYGGQEDAETLRLLNKQRGAGET
jgi:uncharacterized protein (DUF1810 family)